MKICLRDTVMANAKIFVLLMEEYLRAAFFGDFLEVENTRLRRDSRFQLGFAAQRRRRRNSRDIGMLFGSRSHSRTTIA